MYFQIYDEINAILVCQKKNVKIGGISLIIVGILAFILMLQFTDPINIPIVSIIPLTIVLIGIFVIFYKTLITVDHSSGKVIRQTNILGFYKWVRNVWDVDKIVELKREYWEPYDDEPGYNKFKLKISDKEDEITIFKSHLEYENVIKHFNLYIKGL